MASIKVKFRPSSEDSDVGKIFYQVIHERKTRRLFSGIEVLSTDWDSRRLTVYTRLSSPRFQIQNAIRREINRDLERFGRIIRRLERLSLPYTADDVVDEFINFKKEYRLKSYMGKQIGALYKSGRIRTSEAYKSALNSFMRFLSESESDDYKMYRENNDIMMDCIDPAILESYSLWTKKQGLVPNSFSFYARILRAVYNRAVESEAIENRFPFRHVYTGIGKTVRRALPVTMLKRIKKLDLNDFPHMDFARDIFMLSFYLRGMSFIDMAYLKKSDLKDGRIIYIRRKTGQKLSINWEKEMDEILQKYPPNPTVYLLPIITRAGINERNRYRRIASRINEDLKRIGEMAGINTSLTMYVARHSWASIAKENGIPLGVISEGMGHESEMTTKIYLASITPEVVDEANIKIIRSLR